jgi:hypothetical protein
MVSSLKLINKFHLKNLLGLYTESRQDNLDFANGAG